MNSFFRSFYVISFIYLISGLLSRNCLIGQVTLRGTVYDSATNETLIGATVVVEGTSIGNVTDFDGNYEIDVPKKPPFNLVVSYVGYLTQKIEIANDAKANEKLKIKLEVESFTTDEIVIVESRITEKTKEDPRTVESLDPIAIKQTTAANFYDGLGTLKGVDQTSASLGFTVINTRGFNSTSPVRTLQIIDGVDNQAPGLNFSLGNFLGSPELDIQKVDLVVGANSAYYGPNAFNGVISMTTKSPFIHQGLSVLAKAGERQMLEVGLRYAKAFANKAGNDKFAFKINASYLRANDWEAENYDEVYQENEADYVGTNNPGGYDAVNIYGDEHGRFRGAFSYNTAGLMSQYPGVGIFYRRGYKEKDLVDYNTENIKASAGLYYYVAPKVELNLTHSFGAGTTVYQGENRFSLKNITFNQSKIEIKKPEKFFVRAYYTRENDGDTYDAYFTALRLVEYAKDPRDYAVDFVSLWQNNQSISDDFGWNYDFEDSVRAWGWPTATFGNPFNISKADSIVAAHIPELTQYHQLTTDATNNYIAPGSSSHVFLVPGTPEFEEMFYAITHSYNRDIKIGETNEVAGTGFYDKSALWHTHGEYIFKPKFADITVGANFRQYRPVTKGTIFDDKTEKITNSEIGTYVGLEKKLFHNRLKLNLATRADKNQNFDLLFSPALSGVYTIDANNIVRLSMSSAIRNPTLSDQYLNYNVGPATLLGNINGRDSLVTVDSFVDFLNTENTDTLDYFNVAPIVPEKVKSVELGYRTTIANKVYLDGSYYFSLYNDFIGYILGIDLSLDQNNDIQNYRPYRVSTNASKTVTTQGFSLGLNYFFYKGIAFAGNYSWNKLNTDTDDPIIPAFNTPEHKFNVGFNGRDMKLKLGSHTARNIGFNVNYKWVQEFLYEGSPQYTGIVPARSSLDAQVNWFVTKLNTTFKLGATNIFNQKRFQVYGGPKIGRLAYFSAVIELKKL